MFIQYASSDTLTTRLDSSFYNPLGLKTHKKILSFGNYFELRDIVNSSRPITNGVRGPSLEPSEYHLVRLQDCQNWIVTFKSCLTISEQQFKENKRCKLKIGDIVVAIGGYVGNASIVTEDKHAVIGQHSAVLSVNSSVFDSHYLLAYLNTYLAENTFQRYVSGTVQAGINLEDLRSIIVPLPLSRYVQAYIGNKVRQAELLREWANILDKKIKNYFDNLLNNIPTKKVAKKHATVSPDVLIPRINAEFYSEDYRQVEKALKENFDSLVTIEDIAPVNKNKNKPVSKCTYFEIGDVDCVTGKFENGTSYELGEAPNNAQRKANFGDILLSTRRPHRGAVAVVENEDKDNYYSVFLVRLVPKNLGLSYWLKEYLRHEVGKALMLMRCTWTTYPVISEDDISTIPVPKVENDWAYVGDLASLKNNLHSLSNNLTKLSQLLVESLIEGQITEAQLIEAQHALEEGDSSKDRAILNKITGKGYLADGGNPLFTNLGKLYELLDEAKQAVDANEESV